MDARSETYVSFRWGDAELNQADFRFLNAGRSSASSGPLVENQTLD